MLERLNDLLNHVNAVIITSPHNLRYFTGFTGGEGFALICSNNCYLLTDSRYIEAAKKETYNFSVIMGGIEKLNEIIVQSKCESIAFEDEYMSFAEYIKFSENINNVEFVPSSAKIESLRTVKTQFELENMRIAEQIGVEAFNHIINVVKPGMTEKEVALELEYYMRKSGADCISFDTISISGKNTSMPHGIPSDKVIEYGDFLTMDFGCKYNGYCSDMTRTVVVGHSTDEQREIYDIVLSAQLAGLSAMKAGAVCSDVDSAARKVIENAGFAEQFGHALGHGVGLIIHEEPRISPKSQTVLHENMVVTCEPGIYLPNKFGVRIEDMVRITKDGIENLTHLTKDLLEI